jgi:hypothetical protein
MRTAVLALGLLSAGCQQDLGRPPVPRFTIAPEYVPEGDDHQTRVVLDATGSADELDDPTAPIDLSWRFDDPDLRIVDGGDRDATIVVTIGGARPVTIVLTVTDPEGLSSTLSRRLGITLPEP